MYPEEIISRLTVVHQTSPDELFRNNMMSKQDVKIIREALYRIGVKKWPCKYQ